ncbi:hypothetical protein VTK26DRAFT_9014 [Humicola hyalothermophila]
MPLYVITGCRTGIGLEYVRQLSRDASNTVVALVRSLAADLSNLRAVQAQASPGRVHILECDVSSAASIAALPAAIRSTLNDDSHNPSPTIDVLINNAGILHGHTETARSLTADSLHSHMATNVIGPALLFQALYPLFARGARVVNVSSGLGSLQLVWDGTIPPDATPYSISKTALNMLTVHQARQEAAADREGAGKGLVVVCVDPGHAKTEMGGPNATTEVEDSAKGVLALVGRLGEGDNGKFFGFTGAEVPW